MKFYNNLYGAYNSILRIMKSSDTEFTSTILVALAQGLHFILIIGIIREIFSVNLLYKFTSKYYYLILYIPWVYFVYRYYSKDRR